MEKMENEYLKSLHEKHNMQSKKQKVPPLSTGDVVIIEGPERNTEIIRLLALQIVLLQEKMELKSCKSTRALTRPYRGRLTAPSQLKLAEYFPNWVFPKFLNPIKLKNKYYWFFVHTHSYKLRFSYHHLLVTILN